MRLKMFVAVAVMVGIVGCGKSNPTAPDSTVNICVKPVPPLVPVPDPVAEPTPEPTPAPEPTPEPTPTPVPVPPVVVPPVEPVPPVVVPPVVTPPVVPPVVTPPVPPTDAKTALCHVAPGSGKGVTLSLPPSAVASHLAQHAGDYTGACR